MVSGLALPFDAGQIGAPGCSIYGSLEFATIHNYLANQSASATVAIRNLVSLRGRNLYLQWFNLDLAANPLGLTSSEAPQVTFGDV